MAILVNYINAVRAWSFTVTITPMLIGSCLSFKQSGHFNLPVFLASLCTLICGHAAANLVNTYYDFKDGVDGPESDDQTLVRAVVSVKDVRFLIAASYGLSTVGVVTLLYLTRHTDHLVYLYCIMVFASFMYTGGIKLKRIALGDVTVFLTFWICPALFAYLSLGGEPSLKPLTHTLALSINTCAILHSNNIRDKGSDTKAGLVTIPILVGDTAAGFLFAALLFSPYVIVVILSITYSSVWFILPLLTLRQCVSCWTQFRRGDMKEMPANLATKINLPFGLMYLAACACTSSAKLGFDW